MKLKSSLAPVAPVIGLVIEDCQYVRENGRGSYEVNSCRCLKVQ